MRACMNAHRNLRKIALVIFINTSQRSHNSFGITRICFYVGDSDVDVFTANNAGVKMAGVSWGFRGKNELMNAGAPFVADTAEELFDYICKFI
jgi:phosphoglycolate phosphatase